MRPAQYNIEVKKYVDHSITIVFPYDISDLTFYAFVLDFEGNTKLSYSVQKNNSEKTVQITARRADYSTMETGTYRWTFIQEDSSGYRTELITGLWELQK